MRISTNMLISNSLDKVNDDDHDEYIKMHAPSDGHDAH